MPKYCKISWKNTPNTPYIAWIFLLLLCLFSFSAVFLDFYYMKPSHLKTQSFPVFTKPEQVIFFISSEKV